MKLKTCAVLSWALSATTHLAQFKLECLPRVREMEFLALRIQLSRVRRSNNKWIWSPCIETLTLLLLKETQAKEPSETRLALSRCPLRRALLAAWTSCTETRWEILARAIPQTVKLKATCSNPWDLCSTSMKCLDRVNSHQLTRENAKRLLKLHRIKT